VRDNSEPFGVRRSRRPIAVVGATGRQGKATVRALRNANAPVRALTRRTDSDVARALVARGLPTTFVRPVFFMDNFAEFMTPTVQDGTLVVRIPLPPGIPLQMIAVEDVGAVVAAAALDPDRIAGGSIEIAGDELTGEQVAEAYQRRYGIPARYEALPISVLDGNTDQRAMFEWFAHLPAFQADFAGTRALAPGTKTFKRWLETRPDR
jgi:uncharacterized protein YbjT (DUF2867 family)